MRKEPYDVSTVTEPLRRKPKKDSWKKHPKEQAAQVLNRTEQNHQEEELGGRRPETVIALDIFQIGVTSVRWRKWFTETFKTDGCLYYY